MVNQFEGTAESEPINQIQQDFHKSNQLYKRFKSIGTEVRNDQQMVIVDDFRKLKIFKTKLEEKRYGHHTMR